MNTQPQTSRALSLPPQFTTIQQVQQWMTAIYNEQVRNGYYLHLFPPAASPRTKHYSKNDIIAAVTAVRSTFGAAASIKKDFNWLITALLNLYNILAAAATDRLLPPASQRERLDAAAAVGKLTNDIRNHPNSVVTFGPRLSITMNQVVARTQ